MGGDPHRLDKLPRSLSGIDVNYSLDLGHLTPSQIHISLYACLPCELTTSVFPIWILAVIVVVVAQVPSCVRFFTTHGPLHTRPPCPTLSPKVCPSSRPLHWWCHPVMSSSDALFSFRPQSFPASGTFPMSWPFISGNQNTGALALASVLPMSIQGWFPLKLTGLIILMSKGLSGVFYSTAVERHQFFGALPSLWSSFHNSTWPLGRPQPWLYRLLSAK